MDSTEIFDTAALRLHRARAARLHGDDFLRRHVAAELIERLAMVRRQFVDVLCLDDGGGMLAAHLQALGVRVVLGEPGLADAARSGLSAHPDAAFDLVISVGGLDLVNDLPGELALIRRALRPDGLFLAGFVGAGSLPRLRAAMLAADIAGNGASPRIHPQIDVRSAGDLLARAGLALPVADGEALTVRYASLAGLIADLRAAGATNILRARSRAPLSRMQYAMAHAAFEAGADEDGRIAETVAIVYLSGWAPSPEQPQPARRGSGTQSLAAALRRGGAS